MTNLIADIQAKLKSGETTSEALVSKIIDSVDKDNKAKTPLNAYLEIYPDALKKAREADELIEKSRKEGRLDALFTQKTLLGIPYANKDNINSLGHNLTCASRILKGYVSPYNATVIQRLEEAGAIVIGCTNQDEFAMGSSTEYSCYGATRNPLNKEYVSGGSSGGSAAAVASNNAVFSLGTETGGSVRLPASYCGIYGLKTTYGVLSRYGVVAYGSSLDQVGIMAHTPSDIARVLYSMAGKDIRDETSTNLPNKDALLNLSPPSFNTLKIAVPKQFLTTKGLSSDVAEVFLKTQEWFKGKGAKIEVVDLPILDASIASYYVIALSEAASNLSRFDGIRYGARVDNSKGYDNLYIDTRSSGFGPEVKRRIILGNYVLSEQFSGDTYKRAMSVRARIQKEIASLFTTYDLILCPTCPTPSFKLGQKTEDPLEMYLSDMFTVFVNLARIPSISVPAGASLSSDNMPIGMQFIGAAFSESKILSIAHSWDCEHPGCGYPIKIKENN